MEPITDIEQSHFLNRNKVRIFLASLVLIGALIYFSVITFQSAMVYYYTVSEIQEEPATLPGRMVRVSGKLVPESFNRTQGSTLAYFELTDGENILIAQHDGIIPDLFFNEHSEIILEGSHNPSDKFTSHNVIVKCPSKYVAIEEESKLDTQ
ncbi:MAG: cytochrome c maturation protein CcmE [SAR202 cluster bacterium]|nr:cytochrome c maturation protein CcmE [SAR202 cluster bacterium]